MVFTPKSLILSASEHAVLSIHHDKYNMHFHTPAEHLLLTPKTNNKPVEQQTELNAGEG